MALFIVETDLVRLVLKQVEARPSLLGIILWIIFGTVTLRLIVVGHI
jgi:hypothetical protein